MKHLKNISFIALLGLGFFACKEDQIEPDVFGTMTGQVLMEADNSPIAGAIISTTPASSSVQSDANGNFVFENIKEGSFTVRAEATDLISGAETVTIFENETSNVIILMKVPEENNTPPNAPHSPTPIDGAIDLPLSFELSWTATDPNEDELTYDVCVFNGAADFDTLKFHDLTEASVTINDLRFNTTYFWQVTVNDGTADPVFGEAWRFTTADSPGHPFVFSRVLNGTYEIYSAATANQFYQLTFLEGSNYRPRISPAGNRIAFINSNFPQKRMFVMDRDGGNTVEIPLPVAIDGDNPFELDFCWSPDGTKLLYMDENRLYKINYDGTGAELFAELNDEEFIEVDWNGPSGKIAARTVGDQPYESRILLYEEDGTFIEEVVPDVPGSIGGPAFSIDGDYLLYTRDTTGFESPDGRQLESHVFLREIATGIDHDLSVEKPAGFNDLDPRFSPDGAFVIFVQTNNFPNSQKDIYLVNLEGEGRTELFENAEMPDWWD